MMASRILSRFLPNTEPGFFDHGHEHDGHGHGLPEDVEDLNYLRASGDHELDALLAEAEQTDHILNPRSPEWKRDSSVPHSDVEDDVPHSLLMEPGTAPRDAGRGGPSQPSAARAAARTEEQWRRAQTGQPLHDDSTVLRRDPKKGTRLRSNVDAKEQAMWMWTNVQDLDAFLLELYNYYAAHGIWSILLSRAITLLTSAFLFSLYMFLSSCVDYSKIPGSKSTSEVLIPKCMQETSFVKSLLLWVFTFTWLWMLFRHAMDIRRLWSLHEFYHHLLGIPDIDLQTVAWERVVEGLMKLRNANVGTADVLPRFVKQQANYQSKQRMDAHDIANRLMRRDNYFVALFNKELLDLSLPVPFLGERHFYSSSLEFCLKFCFHDFIFDESGQVKPGCLKKQDRHILVQTLRSRLRAIALISIVAAPINIGAHCAYYFSRYYAEYRNSPARLGTRAFTPLAEWKFREFNELEHDFRRRMRESYPYADAYLNQFPKDKTHQLMQFLSLVSGTLAGLLGLFTLLDPELFLGFEITSGRTAFFYISVLMAIFTFTHGSVPDDHEVHDPVQYLKDVMEVTHYRPTQGKHQLHSNETRVEFSSLYQMKVLIFLEEVMSLIITPYILWRNAATKSDRIIDFFRESTVEVDGLGYLCVFSVFNFRKSKVVEDDAVDDGEGLRDEYFGTQDDKMARSQFYFMQRLGKYDQQHGATRHRPHYGMRLPPSFPPLSSSRQVAGNRPSRDSRPSHQPQTSVRLPSPQNSVLLDLPQQQTGTPAARRGKKPQSSGRVPGARRDVGDHLHPVADNDEHAARLDAMTTSKLIEDDNSLGDSWKTQPRRQGTTQTFQTSDASARDERRADNGVLGLLVEYSKAHAGGKGPKIG